MKISGAWLGYISGPIVFLIILLLPLPEGMRPEAMHVAAVAAWMAIWWITEAIPIPATALLPVALFPLLGVMKSSEVTTPYANHLIFLFMGGFFIAVTMERWNLHRRIALQIIRIVGTSPIQIILGFMVATALLSMWISNTATAMMMVPIGLAVIRQSLELLKDKNISAIKHEPGSYRFGTALMLGIAYSASIGGVATIIGTPPNTIVVAFLEREYNIAISFASWLAIGLPLAVTMLILSWLYLVKIALPPEIKILPGGRKLIMGELQRLGPTTKPEKYVLAVFSSVAVLWIVRGFIQIPLFENIHDATIAILGSLTLFIIPLDVKKREFLLDWKTAVQIPWDVILLFGGGLALARAFSVSELDVWLASSLTGLEGYNLIILIFFIVLLTIFLTEVTSNTATSAMLTPVMASIAIAMAIHPYGPVFAAGIAASYAFMLPVATPPNAVVFGSKYISIPVMARVGFFLNILGTILITLLIFYLLPLIWDIDITQLPAWFR
jgi:sodium-dependent dicarboxylate transporter 2/3/5